MLIDITARINKKIKNVMNSNFSGTLIEAMNKVNYTSTYYENMLQKQQYTRTNNKFKIIDTGNHLPKYILNEFILHYPNERLRLIRFNNLVETIIQSNIESSILKEFLIANFHKFKIAEKHNRLMWSYISSDCNVLDTQFFDKYKVDKLKVKFHLKNGTIPSKEFCYEYFTTNYYKSYTEKSKLLHNILRSTLFSKIELNDMLMHNCNFLSLLTIFSENRLDRTSQHNLEILKATLTEENFKVVIKTIQNIPFYK